ncbi:hypothetical protein [Gallibacterium genomosp. 1]|uniref:hypothetical protein n=1 Tax=Gallibacterium genomosp. 1 TaxID=155515 RepID=UPI0008025FC5|nr:hypothetical protein [Gallibacterium genomosp. 1]OBX02226.1 hypothetical protein QV04_04130 [Gallibacterium genomosp. 1]
MKYKGFDFIGLIGAGLSAYGIFQNNENHLLLAGWIAALLLWIGHIIDTAISYNLHCKREEKLEELNQKNDELLQTISSLTSELNISKRTIENQQYTITVLMQNQSQQNTLQQATPRQPK